MPSWTDKTGRTLIVAPASGSSPGRLAVGRTGESMADYAAFWLDGTDVTDISVELHKATGQPVPVITPRPEVDASQPWEFRGFSVAAVDRQVRVSHDGSYEVMPPHAVRQLAGLLVAYADAAESLPDPADVERLAELITEAHRMDPEAAARYLLRKGVTLPGEDARDDR